MKAKIAMYIGLLALAGTILPSICFMFQIMSLSFVKQIMLVSTIVWFATAPFWMKTD